MYELVQKLGIVALRNEKGSYSRQDDVLDFGDIVALRNEKGSYSTAKA